MADTNSSPCSSPQSSPTRMISYNSHTDFDFDILHRDNVSDSENTYLNFRLAEWIADENIHRNSSDKILNLLDECGIEVDPDFNVKDIFQI